METMVREALTQSRVASHELALHLSGKDKGGETILETDIGYHLSAIRKLFVPIGRDHSQPLSSLLSRATIATDKYLTNMFVS
jgi:hypothetical protein